MQREDSEGRRGQLARLLHGEHDLAATRSTRSRCAALHGAVTCVSRNAKSEQVHHVLSPWLLYYIWYSQYLAELPP